jgi:hypothetical protein
MTSQEGAAPSAPCASADAGTLGPVGPEGLRKDSVAAFTLDPAAQTFNNVIRRRNSPVAGPAFRRLAAAGARRNMSTRMKRRRQAESRVDREFRGRGRMTRQQRQAKFWRKLLRLTRGRVTILRALEVVIGEESDDPFREVLLAIQRDLSAGLLLSEALGRQAREFSASVRELIRTAEKCGAWEEILQEIGDGLSDGTFD